MLRMLTYPKHSVSSVCFNADGNKLVSGSFDQTLKVWSIGSSGTFECESTLTGHRYVPSPCIECLLL
jgi:WD40 repeat protein